MGFLRHLCTFGAALTIVASFADAQDCNDPASHGRRTRTVTVLPSGTPSRPAPENFSRSTVKNGASVVSISTSLPAPTTLVPVASSSRGLNASPSLTATVVAELADAAASTPSNLPSSVVSSVLAKVQPTTQCGTDDRVNLPGTGMSVANSMYGAALMSGTQCTNYDTINQAGIVWTSVTTVDKTNVNDAKGYSNIGLGKNVKNRLSSISSIPVYYKWERTNTTEFRGNNCFDFITSPTAGLAGDNPGSSEFMLWIAIWGNQVPIGYAQGPIDTVNLFGISWSLYSGINPGNGVTVRSMLPNTPINGEFSADLKEWLQYMVTKGFIAATDYVNIGNAGSEIFYGHAVMNATTFLTINL